MSELRARMTWILVLMLGGLLVGLPVWAETPEPQESANESPEQAAEEGEAVEEAEDDDVVRFVDEVVVTAGKRETFLLETPIAVTAPSQEQLDLLNVRDPKNLTQLVPSLNIVDSSIDGGGSVEINLRGISNSDFNETGDPNVSIAIDGVYTARPQAALQLFYDVERVEVARGPQGTLAGRNASVGAINVIPKRPETEIFDASAEFEISNEGGRAFRGMMNYPIIEGQLAFRFNVAAQERDSPYNLVRDDFNSVTNTPSKSVFEANFGDVTDVESGAGSRDDLAFRASLLWTPENVPLTIQFDYEDYNDRSPGNPGVLDCNRVECGSTAGLEADQIAAIRRDPFTSVVSTPFRQDLNIENIRFKIQYDIEDKVSLKYKYGESTFVNDLIQDLDAGLANEIVFTNDWTNETEVHEFNLTSLHGGPFQWTAGYFDFFETNDRQLGIDVPPFGWLIFRQPNTFAESQAFYADGTYDFGKLEIFGGFRYTDDFKQNKGGGQFQNFGGTCGGGPFGGPGEFGLVPNNVLESDRDGNPNTGLFGQDCRILDLSNEGRGFDYEDFRFGVGYETSEDTYYYASVATGHKAGNFDTPITTQRTGEVTIFPLEPEKNTTYELGAKGTGLGGKLNYALTAFYSDFEGKQESSIILLGDRNCDDPNLPGQQILVDANGNPITPCAAPGSPVVDLNDAIFPDQVEFTTINIEGLEVKGVEFEYDWAITPNDHFSGFFSWVDAEFKEFLAADVIQCGLRFGGPCPIENLEGNVPKNTPEFSLNATYYHIFRLRSGATLVPLVNAFYRSEYHLTEFNVEGVTAAALGRPGNETDLFSDVQEESVKVNVNLRYTLPNGKVEFELFGSNIFDEDIKAFERTDTGNQPIYLLEDPREFGIRTRLRFW